MRVPVYERRQEIAPLTAPQISPLESAGDSGLTAANTVKAIADRVQQIQNDHEDARTLELLNKFKTDSMAFHEDPEKGIYNTRLGFQSQGVFADADKWLRETGEKYAQKLKSPRAKKNFRDMARQYILQRGEANSRFEAAQTRKYQSEQADAAIQNGLNEIALNPFDDEAVKPVSENMTAALELKHRYSSSEQRALAMAELQSSIAMARFSPMLRENPQAADEWFKKNEKSFTADDREKAVNALETYRVQSIVDELGKKFPPEREQEGLEYIRKTFSGQREERIASAFKTRSNEKAVKEGQEARLKKLQQDELEKQIRANFYLSGVMPSNDQLKAFVLNDRLRPEQAESLENSYADSAQRAGFMKRLNARKPGMSQTEQDIAFMRSRGTTNAAHNAAYAYCTDAIMTGKADVNLVDEYLEKGLITTDDAREIKQNAKKLNDEQKIFYGRELEIFKTYAKNLVQTGELSDDARYKLLRDFEQRAALLDFHDKEYRKKLQDITTDVLLQAVDKLKEAGQRTEGLIFGKTDLGEFEQQISERLYDEATDFDIFNLIPKEEGLPENVDLNIPESTGSSRVRPALEMVQGATITGRFSDRRDYRNGQHNGIDMAAPEGTDITMRDYGTALTVSKVNTSTPSKGGGNSVTLSGTYDNGDTIEVIISHMMNDSINVNVGDVVDIGTVIGKVGNTGMTTDRSQNGRVTAYYEGKSSGFHMDLKIKINGKYVDPETFTPPRPQAVRQEQNTELKSLGSILGSPLY